MVHLERLKPASEVACLLAKGTEIIAEPSGHVGVLFLYHEVAFSRRWMTRGQDFYPVWKRMWSGGGTSMTALSQLVRWCKGAPVLSLSTWRYWCSSTVALLELGQIKPIEAAGYPESVPCVLCGRSFRAADRESLCQACRDAPDVKAGDEALGCVAILVLFVIGFGGGVAVTVIASWLS